MELGRFLATDFSRTSYPLDPWCPFQKFRGLILNLKGDIFLSVDGRGNIFCRSRKRNWIRISYSAVTFLFCFPLTVLKMLSPECSLCISAAFVWGTVSAPFQLWGAFPSSLSWHDEILLLLISKHFISNSAHAEGFFFLSVLNFLVLLSSSTLLLGWMLFHSSPFPSLICVRD